MCNQMVLQAFPSRVMQFMPNLMLNPRTRSPQIPSWGEGVPAAGPGRHP